MMDNFTNTIRGVSYLSTGAGEEDFGCAYVVEEPDGRVLAERRASLLRPIARTITLCVTKLAAQRLKPTGCERWKLLQLRWAVGVHGNGPSPLGSSSIGSSKQYAKIIDQNVHVMFSGGS